MTSRHYPFPHITGPASSVSKENDGQSNTETIDDSSLSKDKSGAKDKEDKAKRKKLVTVNRDLLMACSYFDLGHCGYFETKDLEDMLFTMNLNLSRAQIKKLVSKVS